MSAAEAFGAVIAIALGHLLANRQPALARAEIDHNDPVGNLHHRRHIVLHEEAGHTSVADRAYHLDGAIGLVDIHSSKGLVEQQDFWVSRKPDRDAERTQVALR
jgi:hypothetical protein